MPDNPFNPVRVAALGAEALAARIAPLFPGHGQVPTPAESE